MVYKSQSRNYWMASYLQNDSIVYTKEIVGTGSIVAYTFTCPYNEKEKYTKVIAKLEERFIAPSVNVKHLLIIGNHYNQRILFNYNHLNDPKVSCINCNSELVGTKK